MWPPALVSAVTVVAIAAMPDENTMALSAPSRAAIFSCTLHCAGLP